MPEIDYNLRDNLVTFYKMNTQAFAELNEFVTNRDKRITANFLSKLFSSNNSFYVNDININVEFGKKRRIFGKANFDTCVRGRNTNRICIINGNTKLYTTYCQLNFFKWLYENNLHKWMIEEYSSIIEKIN